ncbi:MAG: hypothetical protein JSV86_10620 [Gemmatimonadota bacterium]|nr:MAG: hypothetical protein JSV86_10620 [Gemmatimonadota bacterium]
MADCYQRMVKCMTRVAKIAPDQPERARRLGERCLRTHERCRKAAGLDGLGATFGADIFRATVADDNARALIANGQCQLAFRELLEAHNYAARIEPQRSRARGGYKNLMTKIGRTTRSFRRKCVREFGWMGPSRSD